MSNWEFVIGRGSASNLMPLFRLLPTARRVFVATYHLGGLVNELRACPENAKITLITKVPSRHERYDRAWASRNKAKQEIAAYKELLAPKHFRAKLSVYFALENHVKVFAVDGVVYVGSANLYPGPNVEGGVIVEDADFVEHVIADVQGQLLSSELTFPFVEGPANDLQAELAQTLTDLRSAQLEVEEAFLDFPPCGPEIELFTLNSEADYGKLTAPLLEWAERVEGMIAEWRDYLEEWFGGESRAPLLACFENMTRIAAQLASEPPSPIQRLIDYERDRVVQEGVDLHAPDLETADEISAAASSHADEVFDEIAVEFRAAYGDWRGSVDSAFVTAVRSCLAALKTVATAEGLDNTGS